MENEPPGVRVAAPSGVTAVLLVEGVSDQVALTRLAERGGRRLEDEGVAVVPMGGATKIARFLRHFGPDGLDLRLAGLCDAGEQHHFCRALEHAGLGRSLSPAGMEMLGFFVSVVDLEDELIRAVGPDSSAAMRGCWSTRSSPATPRGRWPEHSPTCERGSADEFQPPWWSNRAEATHQPRRQR